VPWDGEPSNNEKKPIDTFKGFVLYKICAIYKKMQNMQKMQYESYAKYINQDAKYANESARNYVDKYVKEYVKYASKFWYVQNI
jgi:hypothetical protein